MRNTQTQNPNSNPNQTYQTEHFNLCEQALHEYFQKLNLLPSKPGLESSMNSEQKVEILKQFMKDHHLDNLNNISHQATTAAISLAFDNDQDPFGFIINNSQDDRMTISNKDSGYFSKVEGMVSARSTSSDINNNNICNNNDQNIKNSSSTISWNNPPIELELDSSTKGKNIHDGGYVGNEGDNDTIPGGLDDKRLKLCRKSMQYSRLGLDVDPIGSFRSSSLDLSVKERRAYPISFEKWLLMREQFSPIKKIQDGKVESAANSLLDIFGIQRSNDILRDDNSKAEMQFSTRNQHRTLEKSIKKNSRSCSQSSKRKLSLSNRKTKTNYKNMRAKSLSKLESQPINKQFLGLNIKEYCSMAMNDDNMLLSNLNLDNNDKISEIIEKYKSMHELIIPLSYQNDITLYELIKNMNISLQSLNNTNNNANLYMHEKNESLLKCEIPNKDYKSLIDFKESKRNDFEGNLHKSSSLSSIGNGTKDENSIPQKKINKILLKLRNHPQQRDLREIVVVVDSSNQADGMNKSPIDDIPAKAIIIQNDNMVENPIEKTNENEKTIIKFDNEVAFQSNKPTESEEPYVRGNTTRRIAPSINALLEELNSMMTKNQQRYENIQQIVTNILDKKGSHNAEQNDTNQLTNEGINPFKSSAISNYEPYNTIKQDDEYNNIISQFKSTHISYNLSQTTSDPCYTSSNFISTGIKEPPNSTETKHLSNEIKEANNVSPFISRTSSPSNQNLVKQCNMEKNNPIINTKDIIHELETAFKPKPAKQMFNSLIENSFFEPIKTEKTRKIKEGFQSHRELHDNNNPIILDYPSLKRNAQTRQENFEFTMHYPSSKKSNKPSPTQFSSKLNSLTQREINLFHAEIDKKHVNNDKDMTTFNQNMLLMNDSPYNTIITNTFDNLGRQATKSHMKITQMNNAQSEEKAENRVGNTEMKPINGNDSGDDKNNCRNKTKPNIKKNKKAVAVHVFGELQKLLTKHCTDEDLIKIKQNHSKSKLKVDNNDDDEKAYLKKKSFLSSSSSVVNNKHGKGLNNTLEKPFSQTYNSGSINNSNTNKIPLKENSNAINQMY